MNDDNINAFVPSLLNPRCVRKQNGDISLTQSSFMSRSSLSLRRNTCFKPKYHQSSLNEMAVFNLLWKDEPALILSRKDLLKFDYRPKLIHPVNKENSPNVRNLLTVARIPQYKKSIDKDSLGFSAIEDLRSVGRPIDAVSFGDAAVEGVGQYKFEPVCEIFQAKAPKGNILGCKEELDYNVHDTKNQLNCVNQETTVEAESEFLDAKVHDNSDKNESKYPLISVSSNTELDQTFDSVSESTVIYNVDRKLQNTISVSFGVNQCQSLNINTIKSNIKSIEFSQMGENTLVDCKIVESSKVSSESDLDENVNEPQTPNSLKRSSTVTVNLEIKKTKLSPETAENSSILILNTSAVEKISHIIVQPPNYKLVKGSILDRKKIKSITKRKPVLNINDNNGVVRGRLTQKSIDSFVCKRTKVFKDSRSIGESDLVKIGVTNNGGEAAMNGNSGVAERSVHKSLYLGKQVENDASNKPSRECSPRKKLSPDTKTTRSTPRCKNDSPCSFSSRNIELLQLSGPTNSASNRKPSVSKSIPHHKIVAGTHFAVDAFSYGKISNVNHYFLTHFHSDHYSGLKKSFNKLLFCSKITADLCISRLGVSPKCIHVIKIDETIRIDGVEVTAVEANHCPGAIMLVFTLPSGKTLLHTGDFRASPLMESYPIFWNKDIHTIYLDTTYCNPRYDFPTQEQSLEMALYILRQKKLALEKIGKKFSTVLIVCGTYTIGKEKFFLGMARRVGCSVWACPEKDRVLQAVEGRSFCHAPPHTCQLHVVPMRDLTHEKLRAYLDSLKGAFTEIVAFKPSGWENGKNATVEKDMVTIHGIPYSEHSSFSELVRFVKFLKPKQVVPTVDISGGIKAVQKYFQCPFVPKEDTQCQSKVTDFFSIQNQQQVAAVT